MLALCIWISLILPYVWGNTEKTIFLGPSPVDLKSKTYPTLDYLRLARLNPDKFTVRTHLKAEFPGSGLRRGTPSWFVLHNLTEGQRYEVRVCWAATVCQNFLHNKLSWVVKGTYFSLSNQQRLGWKRMNSKRSSGPLN